MTAPSTGPTAVGQGQGQPALDRLIIVGRSDGRKWTTDEIKARLVKDHVAKLTGEPIPENINQIADKETRRSLALWKVIAARGVVEGLNWPRDSQYQLNFPDGFCLRECTPMGPGAQRQFGMYGHMAGCAEDYVYRAPNEFIPHVLWLLSDSNEHKHCPCKPCHRATGRPVGSFVKRLEAEIEALDATQDLKAAEARTVKKPTTTATTTTTTSKPTVTKKKAPAIPDVVPKTATTAPAKASKKSAAPKTSTISRPSTTPNSIAQSGSVSSPLRQPYWNDEPTLFRRGELVWCQQISENGGWRIGIIREVRPETAAATRYTVIGLGHNSIKIPDMERELKHLRPFLTFSVPPLANAAMKDTVFSNVDWETVLNLAPNPEMIGLEASKLAALEIDGSWSTFNQLSTGPKQPKNITLYGGVFLGAEMVRLGDPIRPKDKSHETLLEVTEISVTETAPQVFELAFRGIEFQAVLVPEIGKIPAQPEGAIFAKDTAFRSLAAKADGKKMKCVWQTKLFDRVWPEAIVAGRSYATNELLHVTKGEAEVQRALDTGDFQEASSFLNSRMQNIAVIKIGRKTNRWATYSQAVNEDCQQLRVGDDIIEDSLPMT